MVLLASVQNTASMRATSPQRLRHEHQRFSLKIEEPDNGVKRPP